MSHRIHLFSLRIAHAVRESCLYQPYNRARFVRDLLAGTTVGIIAIPLAMALAIASGVAPQYGLYTAIVAGFVIALTGGSRFSISGPTAAFIVLLHPVATEYGLGGLLIATLMAGAILMVMALARLGRLIEYIPEAVTLGFTGGIAVVIATLQINDLLGLAMTEMPEHFPAKLAAIGSALPHFDPPTLAVGLFTLAVMLLWPRLKTPIPPHLPAVVLGSLLGLALAHYGGLTVETVGSRFSYTLADGTVGAGVPPLLPQFIWPWQQSGAGGVPLVIDWALLHNLFPAAFAIAMLGAIESLLCAVVLDGMSNTRHSANSELMGQGIGNLIAPFFGGITATAAIARSAANYRAGAESPVAGMVHAVVVLAALAGLAPLLAYLPMATMAAMLMIVAWNMSEAHKIRHLLQTAPRGDQLVLLTCLTLTVTFDMVVAITSGILLASVLFMKEIAQMTRLNPLHDRPDHRRWLPQPPPAGWLVFKINGPLFFAAADRIFGELSQEAHHAEGVILSMEGVTLLDAGGISALQKLISSCQKRGKRLFLAELQFQPLKTIARAKMKPIEDVVLVFHSLQEALDRAHAIKRAESIVTEPQIGENSPPIPA